MIGNAIQITDDF